ncbi:hypothetical protein VNO77_02815 [Canavalia gladiata]|uniref:Uncharacterized protein n=1 Tax=Canavalia gladiata TaxID=3824 RepID=A0AAN9R3C4_CANGL
MRCQHLSPQVYKASPYSYTGFIYTPQTIGAVLILAELLTAKRSKLTDTRAVKQNQCQRFRLIGTYSGSPTETFTAEHSRCENPKA